MRPIIPTTFSGFGIVFRKLNHKDLPLVCDKRNDSEILDLLDDRRKVTLPALDFWFKKVNAYGNVFSFMATLADEPIAYVDLKNCNFQDEVCDDGVFLFNKNIYGANLGS